MKKLLFLGATIAGLATAQAQNRPIRAEVGLNVSTARWTFEGGASFVSNPLGSFRVGASIEYDTKYKLGGCLPIYFAPGAYYRVSGYDNTKNGYIPSDFVREKAEISYISVPLNFGTRISLGKTTSLALEMGPTLAYALSAKATSSSGATQDLDLSSSNANRFEVGLNSSISLELNKLYIRSAIDNAFTNFGKTKLRGYDARWFNTNLVISVGYIF